jgi:hypothetical protein
MVEYSLGYGRRKLIQQIIIQNWNIENPEKKVFSFNELLFVIQEMIAEEGKSYLEGKSINRGFQVFRDFAKYILYRNLANYDSMLLFTGLKGAGKSSAAIMLAREYCKIIGIKFDPARHIAYNNADMMRKINELNKFEPLIADEAVRFACLDGNSIIKTSIGEIPIKKLVNKKNIEIYSYNIKTKQIELKIAEKCIKTKIEDVYEIETEDGNKIRTTGKHLFLARKFKSREYKWTKLENIKEGYDIMSVKTCEICNNLYQTNYKKQKICTNHTKQECSKYFENTEKRRKKHLLNYYKNYEKIKKQRSTPEYRKKAAEKQKEKYKKNPEKFKQFSKKHYKKNKIKILNVLKQKRIKNPEIYRERAKLYGQKNIEKVRENARNYYYKNKKEIFKKQNMYLKKNPKFHLSKILRTQLYWALKKQNTVKKCSVFELLGISKEEFICYIEKQFKTGMTWKNYGKWHIDHIKPCTKFDLLNIEEQKKCFHYTNLQPLWAKENLIKSDKYENKND